MQSVCPNCGKTWKTWWCAHMANKIFDNLVKFNIIDDDYTEPEPREQIVAIITEAILTTKVKP